MNDNALRVLPGAPSRPMTVAEFSKTIKATVEERFAVAVWIEGEVVSAKPSPNGHLYFDLKDDREEARLSCVMWKAQVQRAGVSLVAGARVQLKGRPSMFVPRGQFQFVAELAVLAGAGAQAAALAALKEKLRAEGLFATERKRALPRFPRVIGVVTSATGAALGDIVREADRRAPSKIIVASCVVQGSEAPGAVVRALALVQRVRTLDVVIVGRGGGASEDLAAFNDEAVARAIAQCRVPVVSAVGHDIDHTLADLVADARATTPTQAAAMVTPNFVELKDNLRRQEGALRKSLGLKLRALELQLRKKSPSDPRPRINDLRQRLDDKADRAEQRLRAQLRTLRDRLERQHQRLQAAHPQTRIRLDQALLHDRQQRMQPAMLRRIQQAKTKLQALTVKLQRAMERLLEARKRQHALAAGKLNALSPLAILERGYAVALHDGHALTDAATVKEGDAVTLRLHRGSLVATVTGRTTE